MLKKVDFIMVLVAVVLLLFLLFRGYSKTVGTVEDINNGSGTIEAN